MELVIFCGMEMRSEIMILKLLRDTMIKHFLIAIRWWITLQRRILWVSFYHGYKGSFRWILSLCQSIIFFQMSVMNWKVICWCIQGRPLSQNHLKEKLVKESNCSITLMSYQKLLLNQNISSNDTSKIHILSKVRNLMQGST